MNTQWMYCILLLSFYILIIILCEWLLNKGLDVEYTRKMAHILSTLSCLFYPFLFTSHYYILILAVVTSLFLYFGRRKQLFKSINSINRKSCGSYLLPISIGIIYYLSLLQKDWIFFVLPVIVLAISDPFACVFGKRYKSRYLKSNKTLIGSIVFFISTLIISYLVLLYQSTTISILGIVIFISIIATVVELFSPNGTDNLTIPLSVFGSLSLLGIIL